MLIYDLEIDTFADMYAQTIAYGLFSAKATHEGEFAIDNVSAMIPTTNPFLRNLFDECTRIGGTQKDCLDLEELGVTELVKMLKEVNIEAILQDFGKLKRIEDPVIHFYEDFLREYDPKQKVKRGIFYTPDPVVSFIVRSVDYLLRTEFDCPDGLADTSTIPVTHKNSKVNGEVIEEIRQVPKVQILDPATGTGTFLKYVIEEIKKTFDENHKDLSAEELREEWIEYVNKNLFPRVFGFELLMAPYVIAHLKLGLKLRETEYDFSSHNRLGVALTNALESGRESAEKLDAYLGWLAQESKYANYVKTAKNISVIIGNPPYSKSSYNRSKWIEVLMEDYKITVRQEESQIQALSNDYIKFIRFAQWKIDRTKRGIFGFITGHGYINGPQARDMRASLLKTFDRICILNLHGSVRRSINLNNYEKDDPVFEIQQGTAIIIALKRISKNEDTEVSYAELKGSLKSKFDFLNDNDLHTVSWKNFIPTPPNFYFVPSSSETIDLEEEYKNYRCLTEIFGTGNRQKDKEKCWATGFASQQDEFAISFNDKEIKAKITKLIESNNEEELRSHYKLCTTNQWDYSRAKKELKDGSWIKNLSDCVFRPFDLRRTVFDRNVVSILRDRVMGNLRKSNNLALISSRVVNDSKFAHVFISKHPVDKIFLSSKTSTNAYVFPLYLGPDSEQDNLKNVNKVTNFQGEDLANLSQKFIDDFSNMLNLNFVLNGKGNLEKTFGPEDIFYYIYAVFHSPTFRKRYEEFLKTDFPKVPLTSDRDLFKTLCRLGSELVSLHLMESPELDNLITEFKGEGDNVVAAIGKNSYKDGKLRINGTQYFEEIPEEVYNFYIGGYQVCEKWLKDRKGRELTEEEIEHYQKIVVAINETIRIMKEIDEVIEGHGGWPVK